MKILIDGSNMWYRAYVATQLTPPGGPVMISTYMLRRLATEYGKNNLIICWDAGKSGRQELDSEYKSGRQQVDGVWDDLVFMKRMVHTLGIKQAFVEGYEADDVIGSLAKKSTEQVLIMSYDKDFYQLVDDNINILRPERTIKGKKVPQQIVDRFHVIEEFGCPPEKILLTKSFRGDSSDNIPKISIRFTKNFSEQFYKVILKAKDIEDFYQNLDIFDKKYQEELIKFKDRALLNAQIVQIKVELNPVVEESKLDAEKFLELCQELEITKLKASDWQNLEDSPSPSPVQNSLF